MERRGAGRLTAVLNESSDRLLWHSDLLVSVVAQSQFERLCPLQYRVINDGKLCADKLYVRLQGDRNGRVTVVNASRCVATARDSVECEVQRSFSRRRICTHKQTDGHVFCFCGAQVTCEKIYFHHCRGRERGGGVKGEEGNVA